MYDASSHFTLMCEIKIRGLSFIVHRFQKEMGRSKQKSEQMYGHPALINPRYHIQRTHSLSPEPEELDEILIVSRYGEKNEKKIVSFRFSELITQAKNAGSPMYPAGFPEAKFSIGVKELVIEWEDYQDEFCGYVECLNMNSNSKKVWQNGLLNRTESNRGKQLLRFVKPPGRKTTFIHLESELYFGLNLEKPGQTFSSRQRKHDIECTIKPMFDENEVLPIKNAHLTVKIKVNYL